MDFKNRLQGQGKKALSAVAVAVVAGVMIAMVYKRAAASASSSPGPINNYTSQVYSQHKADLSKNREKIASLQREIDAARKQQGAVVMSPVKSGPSTGIVRTQSQYEWAKSFAVDGIRVGAQWSDVRAKFTDAIPLIVPTNNVSSWKITLEHGLKEADFVNVRVFEGKVYSLHATYSGETAKRIGAFDGIREKLTKGMGAPDKTYSILVRWEDSLASEDLSFSVLHMEERGVVTLSVHQPMVDKRAWRLVLPQWDEAHAWNLRVAKRFEFPEKKREGYKRPAFSRDYRRIYYVDRTTVNSGKDQCHLVEFSLEEQKVLRRFSMPCGYAVCAAVSPDEKKVMVSWGGNLCQVDLESEKTTEFTVSESGRVEDIAWPEQKKLLLSIFPDAGRYCELDLDTLMRRSSERCPPGFEYGRFQMSRHQNVAFDIKSLNLRNNINSSKELCASSRTDAYTRQFSDDPHIGDFSWVVWSPDLRYVLYSKYDSMVMLRLDVRPTPFLHYEVAGIESRLSESQRQKIKQAFLTGRRIWLNVYEPRINPLNGRVVGPDPGKIKGQGFLTQIEPTLRFKYTFEETPVLQGDIVSKVDIDGEESMGIRWPWGHDVWGVLSKPCEGER